MHSKSLRPAALAAALFCTPAVAQEVNVYTYREPALLKPLLDAFTAETGIKVATIFAKEGLEERIAAEGTRSPADVFMTADFASLERARTMGLTRQVNSEALSRAIPPGYRDAQGHWYGLTYRARVAYVSKARVSETQLTYEDLADPKWKGRFCLRSGKHIYNNLLFAAAIAHMGEAKAEDWIRGLKANLVRKPSGGDREVAKDIASGACDIGFANTYYMGHMLNGAPDQKPWAEAVRVVLPKFRNGGTHVNLSGIAIMKNAPNAANAQKLAEWLVGEKAQALYSKVNYEFPVRAGVPIDPAIAGFGVLTPDTLSFEAILKERTKAADVVDRVGFDGGPGS
ncbi:MAG TPA: extracellular solute-binding protein [Beijerinckiaceae bacterium]|nr:extracellular solute-binding protein [Beijerinckiaceae bacterium]